MKTTYRGYYIDVRDGKIVDYRAEKGQSAQRLARHKSSKNQRDHRVDERIG